MDPSDFVNTYSRYMREKYSRRMQRVPLATGIACPHRISTGGCVFCRPDTYTDAVSTEDIVTQFNTITTRMRKTFPDCGWIPYFNAETSTYGEIDHLKQLFQKALHQQDVFELALSTRPDAVTDEIAAMLETLGLPVTVEIGMQSIHERSLKFLKRGHTFQECVTALETLRRHHIRTGVHIIIGIPGESTESILETIRWISDCRIVDEVKFHQLVVYRDTALEQILREGRFIPLTMNDYLAILTVLIPELDERIVVSRLFTSNVRRTGVATAPETGLKRTAMNRLAKLLSDGSIRQGMNR